MLTQKQPLQEAARGVRTSSRLETSSKPHLCVIIRCMSTASRYSKPHPGPQPQPASGFLNFIRDWSAWGPWRRENHRVTGIGPALGLSTVERCVFTPRPGNGQFQPFSLKIPVFYRVIIRVWVLFCQNFMRIFKHKETLNTAIHPPKWLKFF